MELVNSLGKTNKTPIPLPDGAEITERHEKKGHLPGGVNGVGIGVHSARVEESSTNHADGFPHNFMQTKSFLGQ